MSRTPQRRSGSGRTRRILRGMQAIALLTVVVATFLAWQESRPFMQKLLPVAQRTDQFEAMERRPARFYELESRFARRARLESCDQDRSAIVASGADADVVQRIQQACLTVVERNLTIAPASSNEWMVAASLSNILGDDASAMAFLERSIATGPTEEWIAERRAILLFELEGQLDPSLRAEIDTQLQLLLRTQQGVKSIAHLYLTDKGFRERIAKVAESVEPRFQKSFIDFLHYWVPILQQGGAPPPDG